MTGKYGFSGGLELPDTAPSQRRTPLDPEALSGAIKAGESLGFMDRTPGVKRKPGPRRTEPQDKVSIPGPKRVIDQFRMFCGDQDLTLWQGLERLLDQRPGQGS
jgi:hypothetical protein